VAHELGHIVHYDFAVMAVAATLLQIIYEIYVWNKSLAKSDDDNNGKGSALFAIFMVVSYIFYIVGPYARCVWDYCGARRHSVETPTTLH